MRLEFQWRHYVCHCGVCVINNAADITFIVLVDKNYTLTSTLGLNYKDTNIKDKGNDPNKK